MKKLLLFTALGLGATVSAVYSLTLLDRIVHGMLYNFGLQFSYEWASPYWTILRIVQVLMSLGAVFTLASTVYVYRKYVCSKPPVVQARVEKKVIPPSVHEPEPVSETERVGGLVKCTSCNRVFSQPLRMLDFHSDRPRIINICPFCNEVIPPVLRHDEAERRRSLFLKGKKNDQIKDTREASHKGEAKESEETVAATA